MAIVSYLDHLPLRWWAVLPLGGLFAYALVIVYRLFFHPLARFPGPKLAAASDWYEAYYELWRGRGGEFSPRIREMHKKYGPIVRITPNELSINDAEFCATLYAPLPKVRDKHPPSSLIVGTSSGSFSTAEHHLHRKRRAASSPLFSLQNLATAEPFMKEHIQKFCRAMESREGETQELRVLCAALCFDVFFDMGFGDKLNLLDDLKEAAFYQGILMSIVKCAPFVKCFPDLMRMLPNIPLDLLSPLPSVKLIRGLQIRIQQQAAKYVELEATEEFTSEKEGRPVTLFESLRREKLPPEEKTVMRMSQEAAELFAASWTPSSLIAIGLFHLYNRPDTLQKLREELDANISNPQEVPSYKALKELPYMDAVMKEILRIGFPVTTRMPLICREPMPYNEWVIPPGTPMSVNMRPLLADAEVFPEPHIFKPERFLGEGVGPQEERYYLPFGRGARMCQGKDLALYEMYMTVATVIRRYEFELVDTNWERDVRCFREPFLAEPNPETKGIRVKIVGNRA